MKNLNKKRRLSSKTLKHGYVPPEDTVTEWKKSTGEWREIVETCAAFATAKGGRIFVGIDDEGKACGIQIGKGTIEDLVNKIVQNTNPRIIPDVHAQRHENKSVIIVDIHESVSKPVYAFDRPYRRSGRTNQHLSPEEASRLFLDSRGITWDETIVSDADIEDIDKKAVESFLFGVREKRRWDISLNTPIEKILKHLGLMRDGKLNVAAILLFGKNPRRFLSQSALRCARFKGDTAVNFLDMKVIGGNIIQQLEDAESFIRRNISMGAKIEDFKRKDIWEYPLDALREAVTNAICHRDYASTSNVQVRIFDNKLEIWNPGGLTQGMTVAKLRKNHESKPRNKIIAEVFFLLGIIEQFGTGTLRMIMDCKEANVPEPEFESDRDAFAVTFRRSASSREKITEIAVNERQQIALQHIDKYNRITREEYEKITGASERSARRDLVDLIRKKIITKQGSTRDARYEMLPKPKK